MSNDFINRRQVDGRRRNRGGTNQKVSGEFIAIPTFDTFYHYISVENDRWSGFLPYPNGFAVPEQSFQIPIGLMNPWNHADHPDYPPEGGGPLGTLLAARTPTRGVLGFDLTGVPTAASILDAKLILTVAGNSAWDDAGALLTNTQTTKKPVSDSQTSEPVTFRYAPVSTPVDAKKSIWVTYNFDGTVQSQYPGYRAISWGADNPAFNWLKFVNGEAPFANGYNPHEGRDHPWSVKAWYKWGARQFHLHMPFGRPNIVNPPSGSIAYENLAYQADQYICALDGFSTAGLYYNERMPHLIRSFTRIWKSLIEGRQHCTDAEWTSILEWFNPEDPIRVIAYNGVITGSATATIENQYPRWTRLFEDDYASALQRLKDSVMPFIECGMDISLDALAAAPGPNPGQYISTDALGARAQRGWWAFYTWLVQQVGEERLYCEAAPEKRLNLLTGNLDPSPYLGLNIMASEDWSYFPASTATTFHNMSEFGSVKYLRCPHWGGVGPKTRRINPYLSPARYGDLAEYGVVSPEDGEVRINRLAQNTYFGTAFEHVYVARNLKDRFDQEGDPRKESNTTIPGYMMNPLCLQELPLFWGAPGTQRFIDRFSSIRDLQEYLDNYESPAFPG